MSTTTIGAVSDRLDQLVAAQGFTRSNDHFDFDNQPSTSLDKCFRVTSSRISTEGMAHPAQLETWQVEIWLARKIARDPHGAVRQLKVDVGVVEDAMYGDTHTYHYYVEDDGVESEVRPGPGAYAIARVGAKIQLERAINL